MTSCDGDETAHDQATSRCLQIFMYSVRYRLYWIYIPTLISFNPSRAEHKYSATGKHQKEEHKLQATNLQDQCTVLKKCRVKFDCLIYAEMLFIRNIKLKLNTQSGSVRDKLLTCITIEYLNTLLIP